MAEQAPQPDGKVRLDKWLWAARFYKTRSIASDAVGGGLVHLNGSRAKPAKPVSVGDELVITRGPLTWTVVVVALSDRRRSATEAAELYEETEGSRRAREQAREQRRDEGFIPRPRTGRPSKRDRRLTERLKGRR